MSLYTGNPFPENTRGRLACPRRVSAWTTRTSSQCYNTLAAVQLTRDGLTILTETNSFAPSALPLASVGRSIKHIHAVFRLRTAQYTSHGPSSPHEARPCLEDVRSLHPARHIMSIVLTIFPVHSPWLPPPLPPLPPSPPLTILSHRPIPNGRRVVVVLTVLSRLRLNVHLLYPVFDEHQNSFSYQLFE